MKKSLIVGVVVAVLLMASLAMAASYSDVPSTSIYAPAVEALSKAKIMVGSNGLFNGSATVNRYQLAQAAYNLLNYIEKDPLLAKAQDITVLQTVVNSIVKKLGDTNSIVANLQTELNSLKVVVSELKGVPEVSKVVASNTQKLSTLQTILISMKSDLSSKISAASNDAGKAVKLANINNNMIANQAKEIASINQSLKSLKANQNTDALLAKLKGELEAELNESSAFLYKKISVATKPIATNSKSIKDLQSQLASLKKKESDDYVALSTTIPSVKSSLSNQIGFIKNDLKNSKAQLSNQISNTKVALEQEIASANKKADVAMWIGIGGITIGAIGFGTFLYWVWNYWQQ